MSKWINRNKTLLFDIFEFFRQNLENSWIILKSNKWLNFVSKTQEKTRIIQIKLLLKFPKVQFLDNIWSYDTVWSYMYRWSSSGKKENSEAELCMNCLAFMLYIYVKYLEANIVDVGLLNFFDWFWCFKGNPELQSSASWATKNFLKRLSRICSSKHSRTTKEKFWTTPE